MENVRGAEQREKQKPLQGTVPGRPRPGVPLCPLPVRAWGGGLGSHDPLLFRNGAAPPALSPPPPQPVLSSGPGVLAQGVAQGGHQEPARGRVEVSVGRTAAGRRPHPSATSGSVCLWLGRSPRFSVPREGAWPAGGGPSWRRPWPGEAGPLGVACTRSRALPGRTCSRRRARPGRLHAGGWEAGVTRGASPRASGGAAPLAFPRCLRGRRGSLGPLDQSLLIAGGRAAAGPCGPPSRAQGLLPHGTHASLWG